MIITRRRWATILFFLLTALALTLLTALNIGPNDTAIFPFQPLSETDATIVWLTRFPRILLGLLVGIALSSGGCAFQALLRNPLADPYILGVSGGAALGSVVAVALHVPSTAIPLFGFAFALLSMIVIYWISRQNGILPVHTLLLVGVIFNAFAFAIIMLIHSLVTMEQAHEILFLLVGSLDTHQMTIMMIVATCVVFGFFLLMWKSREINVLATGDDTAHHLGIHVGSLRRLIFIATSVMIGAVVSLCGLIGFVGLFVPHMARRLVGSDHRILIPVAGIGGGIFLIAADTIARTLLTSGQFYTELPVGVVTALIGGPFFVWLLKRGDQ